MQYTLCWGILGIVCARVIRKTCADKPEESIEYEYRWIHLHRPLDLKLFELARYGTGHPAARGLDLFAQIFFFPAPGHTCRENNFFVENTAVEQTFWQRVVRRARD